MKTRLRGAGFGSIRVSLDAVLLVSVCATLAAADPATVTALGRLEPRDGVIRVAGPAQAAVVIAELLVDEGAELEPGRLIARLDSHPRQRALVEKAEAELEDAEREKRRLTQLRVKQAASEADVQAAAVAVKIALANLAAANADLALRCIDVQVEIAIYSQAPFLHIAIRDTQISKQQSQFGEISLRLLWRPEIGLADDL